MRSLAYLCTIMLLTAFPLVLWAADDKSEPPAATQTVALMAAAVGPGCCAGNGASLASMPYSPGDPIPAGWQVCTIKRSVTETCWKTVCEEQIVNVPTQVHRVVTKSVRVPTEVYKTYVKYRDVVVEDGWQLPRSQAPERDLAPIGATEQTDSSTQTSLVSLRRRHRKKAKNRVCCPCPQPCQPGTCPVATLPESPELAPDRIDDPPVMVSEERIVKVPQYVTRAERFMVTRNIQVPTTTTEMRPVRQLVPRQVPVDETRIVEEQVLVPIPGPGPAPVPIP